MKRFGEAYKKHHSIHLLRPFLLTFPLMPAVDPEERVHLIANAACGHLLFDNSSPHVPTVFRITRELATAEDSLLFTLAHPFALGNHTAAPLLLPLHSSPSMMGRARPPFR